MLNNTGRNRRLLAGGVGVTLSLALAVSAGAVPRPGDDGAVRTASVSQIEEVAAPAARQPADNVVVPTAAPVPTTAAAPVTTPTTVARLRTTTPPTTKAPAARPTGAAAPAPAAAVAAVTAAPAAQVKVARTTPSSADAQAAIAELKSRVGGLAALASISELQLADAGNQVCTAFDGGQTFAQVKATGLTMIPAFITVTPATVDWAVRKGVAMYCPGHASKLA